MILEVATLIVKKGQEKDFEKDFYIAQKILISAFGYVNHTLNKCIEQKNKYILLVECENIDDHTIGFRQSTEYLVWKKILHHYYEPFPIVEHYKTISSYQF